MTTSDARTLVWNHARELEGDPGELNCYWASIADESNPNDGRHHAALERARVSGRIDLVRAVETLARDAHVRWAALVEASLITREAMEPGKPVLDTRCQSCLEKAAARTMVIEIRVCRKCERNLACEPQNPNP